jgi:hypothetical protein
MPVANTEGMRVLAALGRSCPLPILCALLFATLASAQESPTPPPLPPQTPASSPARSVHISFVPPPVEGTISLGIFDSSKKLVRVLHREAKIDNFAIDESALSTTWDGKSDAGEELPPGKYHARGYMVDRRLNVIDVGQATETPGNVSDHIAVKLEINPLVTDTRSVVDLAVGFDANGTFLKTMDGLPLRTISRNTNVAHASITKRSDTGADVWEENSAGIEQFELVNIHAMMAFDCGDFQLK